VDIFECILDELCVHHIRVSSDPSRHTWRSRTCVRDLSTEDQTSRDLDMPYIAALNNLCQTSKQLNALATRRLYHTLTGFVTYNRWRKIARTLVVRKDLGRLVRHLHIRSVSHVGGSPPPEVLSYFEEQATAIGRLWCGRLALLHRMGGFVEDRCRVLLVLLTSLCPNLESIVCATPANGLFGGPFYSPFTFYPEAEMPSLLAFEIRSRLPRHPTIMSLCKAAPNLKILRIRDLKTLGEAGDFPFYRPPEGAEDLLFFVDIRGRLVHPPVKNVTFDRVEELELIDCSLGVETFEQCLRLVPNLKRLRLTFCELDGVRRRFRFVHLAPKEAVASLLSLAPSLESFELDYRNWGSQPPNFPLSSTRHDYAKVDVEEAMRPLEARGVNCTVSMDY